MKRRPPVSAPFGLHTLFGALMALLFPMHLTAATEGSRVCTDSSDFTQRRLDSEVRENLCEVHAGKVLLVVNTASRCAFTDQYEGLERLYDRYRSAGLVVLGFPSNDFGNQEPGNEQSIKTFCRLTYGVRFPMYAKTRVIGEDADPFFQALAAATGQRPRWNFHKYLIDREGRVVGSFSSRIKPQDKKLTSVIERLL